MTRLGHGSQHRGGEVPPGPQDGELPGRKTRVERKGKSHRKGRVDEFLPLGLGSMAGSGKFMGAGLLRRYLGQWEEQSPLQAKAEVT